LPDLLLEVLLRQVRVVQARTQILQESLVDDLLDLRERVDLPQPARTVGPVWAGLGGGSLDVRATYLGETVGKAHDSIPRREKASDGTPRRLRPARWTS